jgi:uncharacterized membrane protein
MRPVDLADEGGFSAPILIVVFALMVLVLGGVSVDLWRVLAEHREVTGLADGAALAGATAVDVDAIYAGADEPVLVDVEAVDRACRYLADHASIAACPGPDVAVFVAPDAITIEHARTVDLTLLGFFATLTGDDPTVRVEARSTAQPLRGTP